MLIAVNVRFAIPAVFAPGVVAMSRLQSFCGLEDQIKGSTLLNARPVLAATCASCLIPYTKWRIADI